MTKKVPPVMAEATPPVTVDATPLVTVDATPPVTVEQNAEAQADTAPTSLVSLREIDELLHTDPPQNLRLGSGCLTIDSAHVDAEPGYWRVDQSSWLILVQQDGQPVEAVHDHRWSAFGIDPTIARPAAAVLQTAT